MDFEKYLSADEAERIADLKAKARTLTDERIRLAKADPIANRSRIREIAEQTRAMEQEHHAIIQQARGRSGR